MKIDEADKSNAAGAPQEITMNVTNNTFDVYQKQLYLFASTKLVQCTAARIPMHCTEDVHFTYENESVGTYTLKVTTDEDGTKLLAPNLTVSATTKAAVTYGNKLTATLVSDNLGSKTSTEGYLYTDKYKITVNIKNNGSVKYNDYVRLIISNSKNINGQWHYTEKVHVNLAAGATQKLTFESNELNPQLTYYVRIMGNGLINDTYKVKTNEAESPDYVLQRINNAVFTDVDMLQHNIKVVTDHIRKKLEARGESDIRRKVLRFVDTADGKGYYLDAEGRYWRMMEFIPRAQTFETVDAHYSYLAGRAFGDFEKMLTDVSEPLGETIPNFHNMEFRLQQLREVVKEDPVGRVAGVREMIDTLEADAWEMCEAQRLNREGKLPTRICHCDTKVNNMMFDAESGEFLLVIDLDTVMPSLFYSDYGDFLRSAANTTAEDDPQLDNVHFNEDIFKAFTRGYVESAGEFLTPLELKMLPYAVQRVQ